MGLLHVNSLVVESEISMKMMIRIITVTAVLLLQGAVGCAHYDLGPVSGDVAGARSVQVKFFDNKTFEPRLVAAVNHSLRHHLQQDGTFRVENKGDLVVSGVLKSFTRNGVNYKPGDVLAVQDYSLHLIAQVIVKDKTGNEVLNRELVGSSVVRVGADFASGQRQAVPLIADQLALRATSLIADGEWPVDGPDSDAN